MNERAPRPVEAAFDPFAGPAIARVIPTTEAQREVWLADRLGREASLAYNESIALVLRGEVDRNSLAAALNDLAARHEALRATLAADGLTLIVADRLDAPLTIRDLTALSAETCQRAIDDALEAAVSTPFDLATGPLLRAELLLTGARESKLLLTAHHIVCDGWSFGVLVRELAELYAARRARREPALPRADEYAEYARAEAEFSSTEEAGESERYWLARFAGRPPVLDLPTDFVRPARRGFASRREDFELDATLVAALKPFGARYGASLFGTLLTGFAALLARLTGESDFVVGVPSAGQAATGLRNLVGHCVNLLPVRIAIDLQQPFSSLLTAVNGAMLDAFDHPRTTFGTLLKKLPLERDPGRLPLVSVMFNLDQALEGSSLPFPELEVDLASTPRRYENFELFVNAVQVGGGVRLECQYASWLFDAVTIRRWLAAYRLLLAALVEQPDRPAGTLDLLADDARDWLARLNATAVPYDRNATAANLISTALRAHGDRTAAACDGIEISYATLDAESNRLARRLRARGIGRGALVGLHVERGLPMLVAQLAVLKSGAAYVPLDPTYPTERLGYMAQDAGLALLISEKPLLERFDWPRDRSLLLDEDADQIAAMPGGALAADSALDARPDDPAYVIYTSGSTGKPKGVVVPQRSVVNFLLSMQRAPGIAAHDRLLAVTTLSFDIAVLELLLPLAAGAQIVLATRDEAIDGVALNRLIDRHGISVMQATPSTWRMLIDAGWSGHTGFKALVGGEALPPDLAEQLLARVGELWNMYGPTETTVWSTCCKVTDPRAITIGRPIANTSVWILDEHRQPCLPGVAGEICIGGDGVTLGYLNRPELTAERFIPDPFAAAGEARLYRTGDRGRWRYDGWLEHQGRFDFQVKLRGYRIELGEIEATLLSHPQVARAAVITREDRPGDVRLVAYFVARGAAPASAELREHLRKQLPDYMLPQHFVELAALPLLPNGKLDRHALPAPNAAPAAATEIVARAAATPTERAVVQAMEDALSLPGIRATDSFFALGGHSLLAAQLATKLGRALGLSIPLRAIFDAPTAEALAAWIDRQRASGESKALSITPRPDQSTAPLSLMQQRFWFLEQLAPGRSVHNVPSGHRLIGPLDVARLARALDEIVRRQPALRTVIEVVDGEAVQRVLDTVELNVSTVEDLSGLEREARETTLAARLTELSNQPFDLERGPLVSARLFRLGPNEHVFFFMVHHIVWDGWSLDLFYEEFSAAYAAMASSTRSPLPELAVTYGDFAAWQRDWLSGPELQKQIDYWLALLQGAGEPLHLPLDHPRPAFPSGAGETCWLDIDATRAADLESLAKEAGTTLYTVLLATYSALLYRLTGQTDFIIGTPVRGRDMPETERVMGFFVNTLPLRVRFERNATFRDFLTSVRSCLLDALTYSDVPIEHLVHRMRLPRDTSQLPIYQTFFSFQDGRSRPDHWGDLEHRPNFVRRIVSNEDLGMWFLERSDGLRGALIYNTELFTAHTGAQIQRYYRALIELICARPDDRVDELLDEVGETIAVPDGRVASRSHERPAALPQRAPSDRSNLPTTADEKLLADIWAELLGAGDIRATDNFFDLGGHSLLAMRAIAEMDKRLGRRVNPRRYIFETLEQIAAAPDERASGARGLIGRVMDVFRGTKSA
jgi:amino acid adenylation domain-containing protein